MTNNNTELKPCPFCGHKAKHWMVWTSQKHIVQCNFCKARTNEYAKQVGAINAWNRRNEVEKDDKM